MRRLLILLFATAALGRLACGQQHAHELTEEEIGSVHFLTTCCKTTEASFSRAVALLPSFQYELARSVFHGHLKPRPELRHGVLGHRDGLQTGAFVCPRVQRKCSRPAATSNGVCPPRCRFRMGCETNSFHSVGPRQTLRSTTKHQENFGRTFDGS